MLLLFWGWGVAFHVGTSTPRTRLFATVPGSEEALSFVGSAASDVASKVDGSVVLLSRATEEAAKSALSRRDMASEAADLAEKAQLALAAGGRDATAAYQSTTGATAAKAKEFAGQAQAKLAAEAREATAAYYAAQKEAAAQATQLADKAQTALAESGRDAQISLTKASEDASVKANELAIQAQKELAVQANRAQKELAVQANRAQKELAVQANAAQKELAGQALSAQQKLTAEMQTAQKELSSEMQTAALTAKVTAAENAQKAAGEAGRWASGAQQVAASISKATESAVVDAKAQAVSLIDTFGAVTVPTKMLNAFQNVDPRSLVGLAVVGIIVAAAQSPTAPEPYTGPILAAGPEADMQKAYTAYCILHGKKYYDDVEWNAHYERWKARRAIVQQHNAERGDAPPLELNAYADLADDDIVLA